MTKECSPTKIPSFLTKLGFKQINNISDAISYNNENGGEFILIKENDSIYRYDLNSGKPIDNNNILGTKDNVLPEGQNSRWIKCNEKAILKINGNSPDKNGNIEIPLSNIPTGTILPTGTATAPDGFIRCDGAQVSRQTYKNLFNAIGTAYGAGNGSTTFNLPNLNERTLWGNGTGYKNAGLPSHSHDIAGVQSACAGGGRAIGIFYATDGAAKLPFKNTEVINNEIYGKSNTVQPPACVVYFYIKY